MNFKDVFRIPHFIEAPNKEDLKRACIQNNLKDNKPYEYFDIQKEGSKWVAWYYKSVKVEGRDVDNNQ